MKKLVSIGLTTMLLMANVGTAFASDVSFNDKVSSNVSIVAAESVDQNVIKQFKEGVSAGFIKEDGTEIPVDVEVTITELPQVRDAARNMGEKQYEITARASTQKSESGSKDFNKDGVSASQTLIMKWTDVTGSKNTIDNLSGVVDVTKGTRTTSYLYWSSGFTTGHGMYVPATFTEPISYTSTSPLGTVKAELTTNFEETDAALYLKISPSVLD